MARFEPREIVDQATGWLELRQMDLDDPNALLPRGAVLLCEAGHAAAVVENSMVAGQMTKACDFAPLQAGMRFRDGERFPLCRCGARLVRLDDHGWSLNIQGKGWT
ncbi:hypothetical protein [Shinella sp. JR1-6]|uniref:hypothetical protein n=1 Tax=Shinella sp. JR1-6 TaxID=2527671 RepID=UPI00102D42D4|nr:hypothetical protein [Shinella sp. JR1-6]TAA54575.1 hypothetical protein EXZ48_26480 [Shinella sp. JR1-6]